LTAEDGGEPFLRQVLVNLGNRYVVFGAQSGLPEQPKFDPDRDSELLPRLADESELDEERVIRTLRVAGASVEPASSPEWDAELTNADGTKVLIELKLRQRDPSRRDLERQLEYLRSHKDLDHPLEVWSFNTERLRLNIMSLDERRLFRSSVLTPINVWEKTDKGIFDRARVVNRLADYRTRVKVMFASIRDWCADQPHLRLDESRTVTLSEELMQRYAVPDEEMAILDILFDEGPVASFVPRAIWIIGARGRVDAITKNATHLIVDMGPEKPDWRLVSADRRTDTVFDRTSFTRLVAGS
jgi:hypothetical protein